MEAETITIVGTILGSSLMTVALLLRQMNHLETKLGTTIALLDTNVTDKLEGLENRFTADLDTGLTGKIVGLDTSLTDKIEGLDTNVTALDGKVTALGTRVMSLEGKFDVTGRDVSDIRERLARVRAT